MIIILLNRTFLGQQSHSGGQLLWDVVRHALTSSNEEQLADYQPNFVCGSCGIKNQGIVKFHESLSQGEVILW